MGLLFQLLGYVVGKQSIMVFGSFFLAAAMVFLNLIT